MNQQNTAHASVHIPSRFNGPPGIGNGGIVVAVLADHLETSEVSVELRAPAPLGRPLRVERDFDGSADLMDDDTLIARGRRGGPHLDVPPPPSWRDAEAAHAAAQSSRHPFPRCFVCGPARAEGDGLRVVCGAIEGREDVVAAPWEPTTAFVDAEDERCGAVARRYVWAALDCPGGMAALGGRAAPILLARFAGRIERRRRAGERCMAMGWRISSEGRKHVVGTALIDAGGAVLACGEALWIEPKG